MADVPGVRLGGTGARAAGRAGVGAFAGHGAPGDGAARAAVVTGGDVAGGSCGHLLRSGQRRDDLDEDGPADDDGQFAAQGGGAAAAQPAHVGDGAGGDAVERDVVDLVDCGQPGEHFQQFDGAGSAASSLQAGRRRGRARGIDVGRPMAHGAQQFGGGGLLLLFGGQFGRVRWRRPISVSNHSRPGGGAPALLDAGDQQAVLMAAGLEVGPPRGDLAPDPSNDADRASGFALRMPTPTSRSSARLRAPSARSGVSAGCGAWLVGWLIFPDGMGSTTKQPTIWLFARGIYCFGSTHARFR